jgi:DNA replication protein DnaC
MNKKEYFEALKKDLLNSCPLCGHTGWINQTTMCQCLKKLDRYCTLDEAGIAREFWDINIDNWNGSPLVKDSFIDFYNNIETLYNNNRSLLILGNPSIDKTFLGMSLLIKLFDLNRSVFYSSMIDFSRIIKDRISSSSTGEEYNEKYLYTDVLCLDEIGREYTPSTGNSFLVTEFGYLLSNRYKNRRPTILISDFDENFINQKYNSIIPISLRSSLTVINL